MQKQDQSGDALQNEKDLIDLIIHSVIDDLLKMQHGDKNLSIKLSLVEDFDEEVPHNLRFQLKVVEKYCKENGIHLGGMLHLGFGRIVVYSDGSIVLPNHYEHLDNVLEICQTMRNL
jgi:hypothetical protein